MTITAKDSQRQGDQHKMWSMSQNLASRLYDFATVGVIAGSSIALLSTILLAYTGRVKERFAAAALSATSERAISAEQKAQELERRARWRTIAPEQEARFMVLTKNLTKGLLTVAPMMGDVESATLANEFISMFAKAGWIPKLDSTKMLGMPYSGLVLATRLGSSTSNTIALCNIFTAIGIPVSMTR